MVGYGKFVGVATFTLGKLFDACRTWAGRRGNVPFFISDSTSHVSEILEVIIASLTIIEIFHERNFRVSHVQPFRLPNYKDMCWETQIGQV